VYRHAKKAALAFTAVAVALPPFLVPGSAMAAEDELLTALDADPGPVKSIDKIGDAAGVAVGTAPIAGFPGKGPSYLVLSTGDATVLPGDPGTFVSTDLPDAATGADGNDLTQVRIHTVPPAGATCVAFDFAFLSEEYPEYVGSAY
jgi:hypothetical protein